MNVRYNEETDMVQIYFGGEWIDWKAGGMQTNWIYQNGTENVPLVVNSPYTVSGVSSANGAAVKNTANIGFKAIPSDYYDFGGVVGTANIVDVTKYSTLGFVYTENSVQYTTELDISNIEGSYYIFATRYNKGSATSSYYIGGLSSSQSAVTGSKVASTNLTLYSKKITYVSFINGIYLK